MMQERRTSSRKPRGAFQPGLLFLALAWFPDFSLELAEVEGHVIAGEEHIARQREIIRRLEHAGRGKSETAKLARDLLHSVQLAQRAQSQTSATFVLRCAGAKANDSIFSCCRI